MVSRLILYPIIVLLVIVVGVIVSYTSYTTPHMRAVTVSEHYTKLENGKTYYLIVGTDGTIYRLDYRPFWDPNADSLNQNVGWEGINNGDEYCFTYAGWYLPPINWYYITYGVEQGSC